MEYVSGIKEQATQLDTHISKIKIRSDNKIFYDFKGSLYKDRFSLVKDIIKSIS